LFNLPEQTVRSQLRTGRLNGVNVIRGGQSQRGVRFKLSDVHNDNQPLAGNNPVANLKLALDNSQITQQQSQVITPDYQLIIDNYEVRIKELSDRITRAEADNHEKSQKIESLNHQISDLKEERTGYKTKVEGLQNQIDTLKTALEEAQKRANSEESRANSFNNQLGNANAKLQKLPDQNKLEDIQQNMMLAFEKHMAAVEERLKLQQKEIAIKVEQEQQEPIKTEPKGFAFFGFRISKE
jgi:chromosome segregation ATPase